MKKCSLLISYLILSATLARAQSQTTAGQSSAAQRQTQIGATGTRPAQVNPSTIPPAPNPVPFGGTNQVRFGPTNVTPFINEPRVVNPSAQLGITNQTQFGTNTGSLNNNGVGLNNGVIQEPSGAANQNFTNQTSASADAVFKQQLNLALTRAGATRIFFPLTRSTITVVNQNGAVLLQGVVTSEAEKSSIEERVKNSPDVTAVVNQMQVANGQNRAIVPNQNPATGTENDRQLLNP